MFDHIFPAPVMLHYACIIVLNTVCWPWQHFMSLSLYGTCAYAAQQLQMQGLLSACDTHQAFIVTNQEHCTAWVYKLRPCYDSCHAGIDDAGSCTAEAHRGGCQEHANQMLPEVPRCVRHLLASWRVTWQTLRAHPPF